MNPDNLQNNNLQNLPVKSSNKLPMLIGLSIVIVVVGLAVGWFASNRKTPSKVLSTKSTNMVNSPTEAGVKDPSTIQGVSTATGTLQTGGIKGEGNFHLDRPGGEEQTVYLISTSVNLSTFVGKKVNIWGLTQSSRYAPWFMDVVKIQLAQ